MSRRTKWGLAIILVVVGGVAVSSLAAARRGAAPVEVRLEEVGARDLVSIVTASGRIEAKTQVDISADITGRITQIGVREGDVVTKGQFLLQIDPAQYESIVARTQALLASSEASLVQSRTNRDQAKRGLDRALELQKAGTALISQEAVEQAQQQYDVASASLLSTTAQVSQSRASLQEAKDNLAKSRLVSPIAGRVVRLNVEEGEVAVPGTFSRETGLLMTIADLSVILAKVKVDETDVVKLESWRFGPGRDRRLPRHLLQRPGDRDQQQRPAHRRSRRRSGGGLRGGDHPRQSAVRHPPGPEHHGTDHHRDAEAGAQRPDHRADGAPA